MGFLALEKAKGEGETGAEGGKPKRGEGIAEAPAGWAGTSRIAERARLSRRGVAEEERGVWAECWTAKSCWGVRRWLVALGRGQGERGSDERTEIAAGTSRGVDAGEAEQECGPIFDGRWRRAGRSCWRNRPMKAWCGRKAVRSPRGRKRTPCWGKRSRVEGLVLYRNQEGPKAASHLPVFLVSVRSCFRLSYSDSERVRSVDQPPHSTSESMHSTDQTPYSTFESVHSTEYTR